jgi:5-bromo-4-chloroindolyl phosphate hydrolysis protein
MESEPTNQHEREVRAARNQALFRAVNEQIKTINDAVATLTGSFAISCECADTNCIETLELSPEQYEAVRAEPRQFAVLPGHVYPDVENVVRESNGFVVVEKIAQAAVVAEMLDVRRSV